MTVPFLLSFAAATLVALSTSSAETDLLAIPELTKGESIPDKARHDWNFGATGDRGWMFCDKMVTSDARQIAITKVEADSPADGNFAVGDVLVGVGGKGFSHDPRTELGQALTLAETNAGGGILILTRWRAGKTGEVSLKLPVFGIYGTQARRVIPKLEAVAHYFEHEEKNFPRALGLQKVEDVRDTIAFIQGSTEMPPLIELSASKPVQ